MLISNMPFCERPYIDLGIASGFGYTTGGGEYSDLRRTMLKIRNKALEQMEEYARSIGADAIYNCQFEIAIREMNNVIMVTGTAVKYKA